MKESHSCRHPPTVKHKPYPPSKTNTFYGIRGGTCFDQSGARILMHLSQPHRHRTVAIETRREIFAAEISVLDWFGHAFRPYNDPSSATRPAGGVDCNRSAMAGFAAAHG